MTNVRRAAATAIVALGIAVGLSVEVQAEDTMPSVPPTASIAATDNALQLPQVVAQRAAAAGTLAGKAAICKVDDAPLKASFLAMEKADNWTTAQIDSIEMVFTVSRKIYVEQAAEAGCSDDMRAAVGSTVKRVVAQLDSATDYLIAVAGRPAESWIASAPSQGL